MSEIEIRETIEVVKQVSVRETRQRKAKKPSSKKVPTKTDDGVSLKEFGRPASVVVAEPKRPIMKKRKLAQKNTNSEEASLEIIIDGDKELAGNLKVPDTVVETFEFDNEYSLDDDENTDSQSDSSSAEDSEDDYELEMGIKRKEASSDSDSSIHASNVDNEVFELVRFRKQRILSITRWNVPRRKWSGNWKKADCSRKKTVKRKILKTTASSVSLSRQRSKRIEKKDSSAERWYSNIWQTQFESPIFSWDSLDRPKEDEFAEPMLMWLTSILVTRSPSSGLL